MSFLIIEFIYNKFLARLLQQKHNFGKIKSKPITSDDLKLEQMKQNIIEHVQIMQEKTEKFILNNSHDLCHDKGLIAAKFYENLMLMKEEFITMNKLIES